MSLEPPEEGAAPIEFELQKGQTRDVEGVAVTFAGFVMGEHMGEGMSQKEAEAGVAASLLIQKDGQTEAIDARGWSRPQKGRSIPGSRRNCWEARCSFWR